MSTTPGIIGANEDDNNKANLYGVTTFIDAFDGYIEAGYGLIQGYDDKEGLLMNFLTAAYSRRYLQHLVELDPRVCELRRGPGRE